MTRAYYGDHSVSSNKSDSLVAGLSTVARLSNNACLGRKAVHHHKLVTSLSGVKDEKSATFMGKFLDKARMGQVCHQLVRERRQWHVGTSRTVPVW